MTEAEAFFGITIPQVIQDSEKTGKYFVYVYTVATSVSGYDHDKYYVGITMREPMTRWGEGKGYYRQERFWNAIKKYGWENIKHHIIGENLTHEMACLLEKHAIMCLQSNKKEFGYNIAPGGLGGNVTGKVRAVNQYSINGDFIKQWDSAADAARSFNIDRTRITHSAKCGGTTKGYQWRYASEGAESIAPYHRQGQKIVCQYSLDGEFIRAYNTLAQASMETGLKQDNLGHCLKGRNKTAGGFLWKYKE